MTFGDGTSRVGTDIKAGTYRTRQGADNCYWARLKGFSGNLNEIIANANTSDPSIVTILSSDKGFDSEGCGEWTSDLSQITSSKTKFGNGLFIIGTDITPGTYRNSGADSCYWARLKGFTGFDDIIANGLPTNPTFVTIEASDHGFESSGCGMWSKA